MSADLIHWNKLPYNNPASFGSITWNRRIFVVTAGEMIITSYDGYTWSENISKDYGFTESVVWTGNEFVAVGEYGKVLTSSDGLIWYAEPELMPDGN